jgi:hypothetical protein
MDGQRCCRAWRGFYPDVEDDGWAPFISERERGEGGYHFGIELGWAVGLFGARLKGSPRPFPFFVPLFFFFHFLICFIIFAK